MQQMEETMQQREETMRTFFDRDKFYASVDDQGALPLQPFLDKTSAIIDVFDSFGTGFGPVKSDMRYNIEKIEKRMKAKKDTGGEEYLTLQDLLNDEKIDNRFKQKDSGTIAGVWLGRALKFMYLFFEKLIFSHKECRSKGKENDNLTDALDAAYVESLKDFHGMVSKVLFKTVMRIAPGKTSLCNKLVIGTVPPGMEDQVVDKVIAEMDEYLVELKRNGDAWNSVCMEILGDRYRKL